MGHQGETRARIRDSDFSHVQRPLTLTVSADAASTHGLTPVNQSLLTAAGRNNSIATVALLYLGCAMHRLPLKIYVLQR